MPGKSWSVQVSYELLTTLSSLTHKESTFSNEPEESDVIVLNDTSDEMVSQLDNSTSTIGALTRKNV